MSRLKVGDKVYSNFFHGYITVTHIVSDTNWKFTINGKELQAQTPLSYFDKNVEKDYRGPFDQGFDNTMSFGPKDQ